MRAKVTGIVFGISLLLGILFLKPSVKAQSAQTGNPKPAGPGWKNVQVLKDAMDAPPQTLYDTMDFISGSLGVSCDYCHTGPYDRDVMKTKAIAREMIKMTRAINETNFGGRSEVTCNTCHQGSTRPNGKPTPWNKTPEQLTEYKKLVESMAEPGKTSTETNPVLALPDADQVMANYRKATGVDSLKSIHMSGTSEIVYGGGGPSEIYIALPDKLAFNQTNQGRQTQQILNGDHIWYVIPQAGTITPPSDQLVNLKMALKKFLPVNFVSRESPHSVTGIEKLGDRSFYVVESHSPGLSDLLYFDSQSGLLYKHRRELKTLLGTAVTDILYDDYRNVNDAKLPYLITTLFMGNKSVYRVSEIKINVDINQAMFEPPPPKERKEIKIDPKIFDAYVGEYQQAPNTFLKVTRQGDKYFIEPTNGSAVEIFAETETDFFLKPSNLPISFIKNEKGEVTHLMINGQKFPKIK